MERLFTIARSVQAAGISGAVAYGIALAIDHFTGIMVDWQTITPLIAALVTVVAHVVPDSAKDLVVEINSSAEKIAAVVPNIKVESGPGDYPDSKPKGG